jgi:hypothetical protein
MCFRFGLEIIRLVYKKRIFEILNDLRISRPNQNHMRQSDLGKSQDPKALLLLTVVFNLINTQLQFHPFIPP